MKRANVTDIINQCKAKETYGQTRNRKLEMKHVDELAIIGASVKTSGVHTTQGRTYCCLQAAMLPSAEFICPRVAYREAFWEELSRLI